MLAIVVSRADDAAEHVGRHLLDLADWDAATDDSLPEGEGGGTVHRLPDAELRTVDALHLETEGVADAFDDPDPLVFPSRHAGETGPLLTAHHTGNFGPADYGGADGSLARACPNALGRVHASLREHAPEGYDVGVEATHHGPSDVGAPSMFVEVGSDEPQWADPDAARAVARAVLDLRGVPADAPREDVHDADRPDGGVRRHLVGFGGGHYVPRFERVVRETDWAVGHVAAEWALEALGDPSANRDVVRAAFAESAAEFALLEADCPELRSVIEDLDRRVVSETWVRETSGVPLELVRRAESAICDVDEGLRFGDRATAADEFEVASVGEDLLSAATGVDREAVRSAVARHAVAFGTDDGGSLVVGPVVVADEADRRAITDALADVLRTRYDEVRREGEELVAREAAFDPELAREAGVPEGPKFGRLADGDPVEVDGETIPPEAVTRERERRFALNR